MLGEQPPGMALPFELPPVTRGYAALSAPAREAGLRIAAAVSRSLSDLLGEPVAVSGRAVPGWSGPLSPAARVSIDLAAACASALLEVEPGLAAGVVDRLAGGPGQVAGATALTPVESSALELLALAALDGACAIPDVDARLAPRLVRSAPEPVSPLAVELEVSAGPIHGRARLLVPAAAVRALGVAAAAEAPASMAITASLRGGLAALTPAELDALAPGDAVVLDAAPGERLSLVLPGGFRAMGRAEEDAFHVEETSMTERAAEIPITLEVELCRFPVSLADLARLEPGAVLTIPVDRRGLVVLRAGERAFARGELVDVDGAVAVRIHAVEVAP
jgi:type III secretion protein Q